MDEEALAGTRLLIAGGNRAAVKALRAKLAAAGSPGAGVVADADAAVNRAASDRPDAIVALEGEEELRRRLDPLDLGVGPPVVPLHELLGPDNGEFDALAARRLRVLLEHRALRGRVSELEAIVASQALAGHRELEGLRLDTLRRLAMAAEYRDDNTPEHTERVGALSARLARHLGLDDRQVRLVRAGAPLHDLGKIAIPDSILLKPGRLGAEEFEVVKTHAVLGARVVEGGGSELLEVAEQVIRSHHERWDGTGYPDGLEGADIPIPGRIVHVADVFDVLVHERPYRESFSLEQAADEIRGGSGSQFDPEVVAAFEAVGPAGWTPGPEV